MTREVYSYDNNRIDYCYDNNDAENVNDYFHNVHVAADVIRKKSYKSIVDVKVNMCVDGDVYISMKWDNDTDDFVFVKCPKIGECKCDINIKKGCKVTDPDTSSDDLKIAFNLKSKIEKKLKSKEYTGICDMKCDGSCSHCVMFCPKIAMKKLKTILLSDFEGISPADYSFILTKYDEVDGVIVSISDLVESDNSMTIDNVRYIEDKEMPNVNRFCRMVKEQYGFSNVAYSEGEFRIYF